jgi:hypothetical protein
MVGSGYNHNNNRPWELKEDLDVHASVYGKVQAGPRVDT